MNEYKSPIEIIYDKVRWETEDNIVKAVQSYRILVNKEELLRALDYDRAQYEKGFESGYEAGKKEAERPTGYWIPTKPLPDMQTWKCSICGQPMYQFHQKYCSSCGAKMEVE